MPILAGNPGHYDVIVANIYKYEGRTSFGASAIAEWKQEEHDIADRVARHHLRLVVD